MIDFTTIMFPFFFFSNLQFDEAFSKPDPKEELRKHVDPRLDHAYPLDSVLAVRSHYLNKVYVTKI